MRTRHKRCGFAVPAFLILVLHAVPCAAHTDITAAEAYEMLQTEDDVILLDVREYYEFCGSLQHIEDAVNLPWLAGDLEARYTELPTDAKIIVVCAAGSRSDLAANFLDGEGFTNVYDMLGGMSDWTFEIEECDPEPVLRIHGGEGASEINWTATTGVQDYDLLRGQLDALIELDASISIGIADCLANDSPFTYLDDADLPLVGEAFIYLSRQKHGSLGFSSARQPRVAENAACD